MGELTCCRLGHKVKDVSGNGKTIPCDKQALRQVLSTMYIARLKVTALRSTAHASLVSVNRALFGDIEDQLQDLFMSAMESLGLMSDSELHPFLRVLAASGNHKLLLQALASNRIQQVFTRRWYDDVFIL